MLFLPRHFCRMRAMIVTRVALFLNYSLLAMKHNVKANRTKQKNKIKYIFGPDQTSEPNDSPGVKTPLDATLFQ